ncbi:MAG: glycosyltransferase [Acidobacteriia bacterium]|nr:glycosyltransferase [Terriglobia bacterium]
MPLMVAELAGAGALAVWLYLLIGRGGFWLEFCSLGQLAGRGPSGAPRIAAIVPARNEADVVGRAIASLAHQEYAGEFRIVLVDDDSADGTAGAARAAAPPEVLTVIRAAPAAAGWTGKVWALSQGIREAARSEPDYLLLADADIEHPPGSLRTLAARAESGGYDLVSYMATLACRTPAERSLVPAFVFFFFLLYPPAWIRSPHRRTAGAAGGCLLIRRAMLERIGGMAAIGGALIDDCALARAVKHHGGRVWLGLDTGTLSLRQYATFRAIGRMISRTAFAQLHHSVLLVAGTAAGLALTFLVPPLLTLAVPQPVRGIGAMAWLLMSVAYFPALRFYRCPWFMAPLVPLAALFYLGATVHSALSYWRGAGGMWKGRAQDLA